MYKYIDQCLNCLPGNWDENSKHCLGDCGYDLWPPGSGWSQEVCDFSSEWGEEMRNVVSRWMCMCFQLFFFVKWYLFTLRLNVKTRVGRWREYCTMLAVILMVLIWVFSLKYPFTLASAGQFGSFCRQHDANWNQVRYQVESKYTPTLQSAYLQNWLVYAVLKTNRSVAFYSSNMLFSFSKLHPRFPSVLPQEFIR